MRDIRTPLHILADSREQQPWAWEPSDAVVEFAGLSAGDYCLKEDSEIVKGRELRAVRFSVERKNLADLAGTISSGWTRFNAELDRMSNMCARIILVEGNFEQCCWHMRATPDQFGGMMDPPEHGHPLIEPAFVARRIAELSLMQVSVLFCGNAQMAACMALHIFRRRADLLDSDSTNTQRLFLTGTRR